MEPTLRAPDCPHTCCIAVVLSVQSRSRPHGPCRHPVSLLVLRLPLAAEFLSVHPWGASSWSKSQVEQLRLGLRLNAVCLCIRGSPMTTCNELSLLRLPDVVRLVGLSRASIYSRLDSRSKYWDPSFPRPISLSPSGRGSVAWVSEEVETWIRQRIETSRRGGAQN